ncbi:MAG: hypothetical protein IKT59_07670 [Bacteroidales bacterium]|jgi:hypothetical protein|nr:hypothetical protein [Bacteroidales bacterium]
MRNFIEDYLNDPSGAVSAAVNESSFVNFGKDFDEDSIYEQISSGEFRLYEEILFSGTTENSNFASVA